MVATSISAGSIAYHSSLTRELMQSVSTQESVQQQQATPAYDIFTGYGFAQKIYTKDNIDAFMSALDAETTEKLAALISMQSGQQISVEKLPAVLASLDDETFARINAYFIPTTDATYEGNLTLLGYGTEKEPASISLYAHDFASKDAITAFIEAYNQSVDGADSISYTDVVGLMMSSITTIINVISYVLIAFVSISLVVSSIMIGIITYISVLERTREIGVLRSIGASKGDISRVFNAETLIVGFAAGAIGIAATLLLCLPINAVIRALSGIPNIGAVLPLAGGIVLVVISMVLTLIAGFIPSRLAAKKDPVVALRSE